MLLPALSLALQLQGAALAAPPSRGERAASGDSALDLRHAHAEQSWFERRRRALLPWSTTGADRCDARVGRFCWWFDDSPPRLPPEDAALTRARRDLLRLFDSLGTRWPADPWLIGMRVYYRVDGQRYAEADSVARQCAAEEWWCGALRGFSAYSAGRLDEAGSAFRSALSAMPPDVECRWRDIGVLLSASRRQRYESTPCPERRALEERYWMLGRPQLATPVDEWRTEFLSRRVLAHLAARSATPQTLRWGDDAAELLLRYGWPTAWSRVRTTSALFADPAIVGHDPTPSFPFAPEEELLDSLVAAGDERWHLDDRGAPARFAPRHVKRLAPVAVQFARFRRGESTLVVAAFAAGDDSLLSPVAALAAVSRETVVVSAGDSGRTGTLRLLSKGGDTLLVGVEVADTLRATLARARAILLPREAHAAALSDVLLYRPGAAVPRALEEALPLAIAGDTVVRAQPVGVYWERYGPAGRDTTAMALTMERVDRGWLRSARQRLRLAERDAPLRMSWQALGGGTAAVTPDAVSLDLATLPAGRYRLTLTLEPNGPAPASASRELELVDR